MLVRRAVFVLVALVLTVTPAFAAYEQPLKAKKGQFDLVNGAPDCTVLDQTLESGIPGCALPLPAAICRLGVAKGKGKLQIKRKKDKISQADDIQIKGKVKGLVDCEGVTLTPKLSVRITATNCTAPGGCTTATNVEVTDAACVVEDGKCKFDGFVGVDPVLKFSNDAAFSILGCAVQDIGAGIGYDHLECGLTVNPGN